MACICCTLFCDERLAKLSYCFQIGDQLSEQQRSEMAAQFVPGEIGKRNYLFYNYGDGHTEMNDMYYDMFCTECIQKLI